MSKTPHPFPVESVRSRFPALEHAAPFVYFDNAAGAQTPQNVLDATARHLLEFNVQRGGRYPKSVEVDRVIDEARRKVALFLNARSPEEIAFGMNATSFMRLISLAVGQTLTAQRSEIIVTDLDHHANISTWLELERMGATIRWWRMRDDYRLHVEDLIPLLSERTKLTACTVTSHALGSRVDVTAAASAVHAVGADIFLDCVHYSPHALIDVQAWDCDYLVCSGYKAFVPHMGFLWGKYEKLSALPTFREEFIPDAPPHKSISAFLVERGMGVDVKHLYGLMGTRGGGTGRILLRDVRVPAENLVGKLHGGTEIFNRMMVPERLTSAAGAIGMGRAALEVATRYAQKRKAFGRAIKDYQAVSFRIAESVSRLDAARALAFVAGRTVDAGLDGRRLVSEAKKIGTEAGWATVNDAMQVLGGIGYTSVFPVERMLRDLRLTMIWTGTNEVMNLLAYHEYVKELLGSKAVVRDVERDAGDADAIDEKVFE